MFAIGQNVSHYNIVGKLGKGGMGEVYRAKDEKLGREVAIKVLPEEFAKDADRLVRFQREAKLLASLNHPNIASIYGLEEADGISFLVLELIEGGTLADRLKTGPIPIEESLKLAIQIIEALEAAHEKGVIHRDLKPSNIKVTPDGKIKVLDFGLAKAYAGDREEVNLSNSPTLSDVATRQGLILGTAAYMSPEQARGKSLDKRADIWAFGCVLFEMMAGRAAFTGKDVTDILAAVIRSEPEWTTLPELHWRLREVLERCLEKEAKDRYHDISDVRVDIQRVLKDPGGVLGQPSATTEPGSRPRRMLVWIAAAVVLTAVVAGVVVWRLKPSESPQVMRFEYELPEGQQLSALGSPLAVSPDGKKFVYSTNNGLYLRSADEWNARLIAGTEGLTQQPFFSPDGRSIGYFSPSDRQLKKIAINGGAPVALCTVNQLVGGWWNADDTIVYGQYPLGPIMRISANGGTPEALIKPKSELLIFPQILPGGRSILYTSAASTTQMRVMVQPLASEDPKELFAGAGTRFLSTGHLVYTLPNNNNLFAVPFDPERLELAGAQVPIVQGVGQWAVSDTGTLVFAPASAGSGSGTAGRSLVWIDRKGQEEKLESPPDEYRFPNISPDGTKIALTLYRDAAPDLFIWDLVRKTMMRLTFDEHNDVQPLWTPDGRRIIFWSGREGGGIYEKAADGSGEVEKIFAFNGGSLFPFSWSRDGKTLVMGETDGAAGFDIEVLSMEGDRTRKPLLHEEKYTEVQPQVSPNGGFIAYTSSESSQNEVYVRPFPEVDKGRWQVSTAGGDSPLWSPDGRELFYLNGDAVMAVPVEYQPNFSLGTPRVLFKGTYVSAYPADGTPWDISPDGKRFLMIKLPAAAAGASQAAGPQKIDVIVNWLQELKQRVPTQ